MFYIYVLNDSLKKNRRNSSFVEKDKNEISEEYEVLFIRDGKKT